MDAAAEYDDFLDRAAKTKPAGGTGCLNPGASCDPATAAGLTGQWLFALSTPLGPTKPILFFADVTAADAAGGIELSMTITPLHKDTRTPLASALPPLPPSTVAPDGKWAPDLPPLAVPGDANPISGSDVEADVALDGEVCGGRDFLCGEVTGAVTKLGGAPINIDLAGSSWTLTRLPAPDTLPSVIYVSCACACAVNACPSGDGGASDGGVSDASTD